MPGGRPSIYEEQVKDKLIIVEGWARDGLTNEQIATNIGINVKTLYEWQKKYKEFSNALKRGKEIVDREVENALFREAKRGNVTAIIFWLKNRKPAQWRDKQEIQHSGDMEINVKIGDDDF